jgi:tetratricopeptide (TPR) repeat protein
MRRRAGTHVDDPRLLAQRLREARERAGLSQRELSFTGCTSAYISRLEAGARTPSLQMINELAGRLDVSPQWLATGVEPLGSDVVDLVDAEVAARLGDVDEARRLFNARLHPGDPAYAAALAGLGQIAFREERVSESIDLLERALDARKRRLLVDPSAVETLGRAYAASGALEEALALFSEAHRAARAAAAPVEELRFGVLLANALIDSGTFGEAEAVLAGVINLTAELKDPIAQARLYWSQSRLHVVRGETQLAARYARRALDILERTEHNAYVAMAYHLLAYAEIDAGNAESALELLDQGRQLFGTEMTARDVAKFALEEARALLMLRRRRRAAKAAGLALEHLEHIDPQDRGRAFVALGDVFAEVGESETARDLYERGLALLSEQGRPYAVTAARRLAEILEAEGDSGAALDVLMQATALADRKPARP